MYDKSLQRITVPIFDMNIILGLPGLYDKFCQHMGNLFPDNLLQRITAPIFDGNKILWFPELYDSITDIDVYGFLWMIPLTL